MSPPIPCPESLMPLLIQWSRMAVGLERWATESLPDLGIDLLTAGYDTPAIMALAVSDLSENSFDLWRKACKAFASLGVPDEEDTEFHLIVAGHSVISGIADGTLPPEEGLRLMVAMWCTMHYPGLLVDWTMLGEAIYLSREGIGKLEPYTHLTEATIPETIRTLARQFLAENPVLLHPPSS